jgi:hypothetical protein
VAADLRGDLLGAEADVTRSPQGLDRSDRSGRSGINRRDRQERTRWLSPLALWTGILAGPLAWAFDLGVSYALVKWTCSSQRDALLHLLTPAALAVVAAGAIVSFLALQRAAELPADGGAPSQRAQFMAVLGLASCAMFAVTIVAGAIPQWVLDACQ